jgi:hypothetical protein
LSAVLNDAEEAFEGADVIAAIGFSFADADFYISRMISKSMQGSSQQKLLIVDPDSRVVERVRRKFKASIPNFDKGRVIRVLENCSTFVPNFLEKEPLKEESPIIRQNVDIEEGDYT